MPTAAAGLVIAIVAGMVIGRFRLEGHVEAFVYGNLLRGYSYRLYRWSTQGLAC